MANGPLGGFMPTPASPSQPPQVKLDTTAASRGTFNNFLKNMGGVSAPPSMMAPSMGAMMPLEVAPAISDIDIFNPPVQMMFNGGEVDDSDFGGFSDYGSVDASSDNNDNNNFSFSDDTVGDTSAGDFTVGDTEDRSESDNFQSALDNITLGSDNSMFSNDPASATLMGLSYPSAQNFGSRNIPNLDANTINALKAEINSRNEVSLADKDEFFNKDFTLNDKGKQELDNLNKIALNEVISGDVPASNYISVDDKSGLQDALSLTKSQDEIDPFDIQPSYQNYGLPGVSGLPTVQTAMRSSLAQQQLDALKGLVGDKQPTIGEQLQQNVLADRGRALGPTTFADDLANFSANVRGQTPNENSRVGDDQLAIDEAERAAQRESKVGDDFQIALDLVDARQKALTARDANVRDMDDIDIATAGRASDFPTLSTAPEDFEENVGRKFDADRMADIERLYGEDIGQTKAGRGSDPTFFEGKGFTGTVGGLLDAIERKTRENMANEIALGRPMGLGETFFGFTAPNLQTQTMKDYMSNTQKNILNEAGDSETVSRRLPENQLIRNDSGRVIGIRDASGRLVSGMDPNAPMGSDDNTLDPIIRPIIPVEEEDDTEAPPNIMGAANPFTSGQSPVFVESPFTTNIGDFRGTGFDAGDLNALIAQITRQKLPRAMAKGGVAEFANGGLIQAVDEFLSTGT
jgi:hypothetical protein